MKGKIIENKVIVMHYSENNIWKIKVYLFLSYFLLFCVKGVCLSGLDICSKCNWKWNECKCFFMLFSLLKPGYLLLRFTCLFVHVFFPFPVIILQTDSQFYDKKSNTFSYLCELVLQVADQYNYTPSHKTQCNVLCLPLCMTESPSSILWSLCVFPSIQLIRFARALSLDVSTI